MVSSSAQQGYVFDHANCQVRFPNQSGPLKQAVLPELEKLLKVKNFKTKPLLDGKYVIPGELYVDFDVTSQEQALYNPCVVKVRINQAKGNKINLSADKSLFVKEIKRQFPRITPKGKERCIRALRDVFTHIPYCKIIGYAGEKK
jgi:hypothetical protein